MRLPMTAAIYHVMTRSSLPVENQRAQFDALARLGVRRGRGIDESRVRPEPGPAVGDGIVAFQQNRLIRAHLRKVEPAMVRIVFHRIGFAPPIWVNQVGSDEIA